MDKITQLESRLLVKWLRDKKNVPDDDFDGLYFAKLTIEQAADELKVYGISKKEIIAAIRRDE